MVLHYARSSKSDCLDRTHRISQRIRITELGLKAYERYCDGKTLKQHDRQLTLFRLTQFQRIQLYYVDFSQKQKLTKLIKVCNNSCSNYFYYYYIYYYYIGNELILFWYYYFLIINNFRLIFYFLI